MKKILIIVLAVCGVIGGCASINGLKSHAHYIEGTSCLEYGDYYEAVAHLEAAVYLDPLSAKNHLNLCSAYLAIGEVKKAWVHSRQSVLLGNDPIAFHNFYQIYQFCEKKYALNKLGQSEDEILRILGAPDQRRDNQFVYGILTFTFDDHRLVAIDEEKSSK